MANDNVYSDQPRYGRDVTSLMRRINALEAAVDEDVLSWTYETSFAPSDYPASWPPAEPSGATTAWLLSDGPDPVYRVSIDTDSSGNIYVYDGRSVGCQLGVFPFPGGGGGVLGTASARYGRLRVYSPVWGLLSTQVATYTHVDTSYNTATETISGEEGLLFKNCLRVRSDDEVVLGGAAYRYRGGTQFRMFWVSSGDYFTAAGHVLTGAFDTVFSLFDGGDILVRYIDGAFPSAVTYWRRIDGGDGSVVATYAALLSGTAAARSQRDPDNDVFYFISADPDYVWARYSAAMALDTDQIAFSIGANTTPKTAAFDALGDWLVGFDGSRARLYAADDGDYQSFGDFASDAGYSTTVGLDAAMHGDSVFLCAARIGTPGDLVHAYSLGLRTYDQTDFKRYDAAGVGTSLGTPDAGGSVPGLEDLVTYNAAVHAFHLRDLRSAVEAVAPYYENDATSTPWNFDDGDTANNLYRIAMGDRSDYGATGGARFIWTREVEDMHDSPTYDIDVGEVAECVRVLENDSTVIA